MLLLKAKAECDLMDLFMYLCMTELLFLCC